MVETNQDERNKVLEEQRYVTSKISDLCRYIGFGIAAATYSIFSSSSDFAVNLLASDKVLLVFTAIAAILVIIVDYLQFLFGYIIVRVAIHNKSGAYKYNSDSLVYKGKFVFFYIKQVLTGVSVLLLLTTLIRNISQQNIVT